MAKATLNIGFFVNCATEFGRQLLLGGSKYIRKHRSSRLVLISDSANPLHIHASKLTFDVIIAQTCQAEELAKLGTLCPRVLVVSNQHPVTEYPQLINDDVAIGRLAFRHFYDRGFRSFAYLPLPGLQFSAEREAGFCAAAQTVGLAVHICEHHRRSDLSRVVGELEALPQPVALLVINDNRARELICAIPDAKIRIPRRLAVLGVDDDPLQNALSPVALSSVSLAGARIGYEAAARGVAWIHGRPPAKQVERWAPRYVAIRASTDFFAVSDPIVQRALRLMEREAAHLPTVESLVERLKINRRSLEKRFQHNLGNSLAKALLEVRLRQAQMLLCNSDLTAAQISDLVGFSEPRMLSLVFRRELGETPTAFRQRTRAGTPSDSLLSALTANSKDA